MASRCFFKSKFNCEDGNLTIAGPARIQTIVKFSKEYKDYFYLTLEEKLRDNPNVTIGCHRNCVSTYTSKERLNRHRKRESSAAESDPSQPPIKQRRSTVQGFSFKEQCIFCGESCAIEKDKKHPHRWRRAVLRRTADASPGKKSFKKSILKVCDQRKDHVAEQMRFRVEAALSDLHAADARYHVDCMTSFMSANSIAAAQNASKVNVNEDPAFDSVTEEMVKDKSRLWNSVQLYHLYQLLGGKILSRRALLLQIKEHFSDEIAVLSSPGLASTVVFNNDVTTVLNLLKVPEDDQEETSIENLSKKIVSEALIMTSGSQRRICQRMSVPP